MTRTQLKCSWHMLTLMITWNLDIYSQVNSHLAMKTSEPNHNIHVGHLSWQSMRRSNHLRHSLMPVKHFFCVWCLLSPPTAHEARKLHLNCKRFRKEIGSAPRFCDPFWYRINLFPQLSKLKEWASSGWPRFNASIAHFLMWQIFCQHPCVVLSRRIVTN